jgi:TRAP-type mannitol/chloroaromatic compound transport system permease large subunit
MFGVLLLLGMFMEQISIMLLTVPIFFPLAQTLGFDPIWFGLIMLLALEISFTTPPFGLLLFVMKGVAPPGTTMREIYRAAIPFILCSLLLVPDRVSGTWPHRRWQAGADRRNPAHPRRPVRR